MSDPNPYASPQTVDRQYPAVEDERLFRRRVRWAVGFLAPLAMANWLLLFVQSVFHGIFVLRIAIFLVGVWLIPCLLFAFLRGDQVLAWLGRLLHRYLGGNVPLPVWLAVGRGALWMLPYAAAAGALLWAAFLFCLANLALTNAGWFAFGVVGNALGAWCYLTLLYRWWQLRNSYAAPARP